MATMSLPSRGVRRAAREASGAPKATAREEDDRTHSPKETKDVLCDSSCASWGKKHQHLTKARKVPRDTLPLKKRSPETPLRVMTGDERGSGAAPELGRDLVLCG